MAGMRPLFGGEYALYLEPNEVGTSHWIDTPLLVHVASGRVLLDLRGGVWELTGIREDGQMIVLGLQRCPEDSIAHEVVLLPASDEAVVAGQTLPLRELEARFLS